MDKVNVIIVFGLLSIIYHLYAVSMMLNNNIVIIFCGFLYFVIIDKELLEKINDFRYDNSILHPDRQ